MHHWNYRVVRHLDECEEWFGIHEVYYETDGDPSMTVDPVPLCAGTFDGLRQFINRAFEMPILDYDSKPQEGG